MELSDLRPDPAKSAAPASASDAVSPGADLVSRPREVRVYILSPEGAPLLCLAANATAPASAPTLQPRATCGDVGLWMFLYVGSFEPVLVNLQLGVALAVKEDNQEQLCCVPLEQVERNQFATWTLAPTGGGTFAIRPRCTTDRNLNVPGSDFSVGKEVIAWHGWDNDPNEKWYFIDAGSRESSLSPDLMLLPLCRTETDELFALTAPAGGPVTVALPNVSDASQRWTIDYNFSHNGAVLTNRASGQVLAVSPTDNTTLVTIPGGIGDHAVWTQSPSVKGLFALRPAFDNDRNLNVTGGGPYAEGTPVIAYHGWNNADNERWSFAFIPVGGESMPDVDCRYTNEFGLVWDDHGSGAIFDVAVYRPQAAGYRTLGFVAFGPATSEAIGGIARNVAVVARSNDPSAFVAPVRYEHIASDHGSGADMDGTWWRPVPPPSHVAIGSAFAPGYDDVPRGTIWCVRRDLACRAEGGKMKYADQGSGAHDDSMFFEVRPAAAGLFVGATVARVGYDRGSPPRFHGESLYTLLPKAGDNALSEAEVRAIIEHDGPVFRFHRQETFMPMSVEKFLEHAHLTPDGRHLDVDDPRTLLGDLASAVAYVFVHQVCQQFTDLQFWLFYGNNGKTFIHLEAWANIGSTYAWSTEQDFDDLNNGEHVGDWEHVTLRVDNGTKRVVAVGYTSHGDTEWYSPGDGRISVYSALHMHGSYPVPGAHRELAAWQDKGVPSLGSLQVKIFSRNICDDGGALLDSSHRYQIVQSNTFAVDEPYWLKQYAGVDWGPAVKETDELVITDVPVIGGYPYKYEGSESGPSTPSYKAE